MFIVQTNKLLNQFDSTGMAANMHNAAYQFGYHRIGPLNKEMDSNNSFPSQLWEKMGSTDLHGITVDEQYGGSQAGYLAHMGIVEAISYWSGSVGLSYIAHSNLCMNQIQLNGNEAQKQKFLPKLCTGQFSGALAMSEPGAGSDVMAMTTSATKFKDGYLLNGQKLWITNGGKADVMVVYAKIDEKMTAFLVEKGMTGFNPGKKLDKMGMRGSETYEIFFDDCYVPDENILGQVGRGSKVLMSGLNYERLLLAAGPLGLAQHSLDFTLSYLKERKQFNEPLIEKQALGHQLAEMRMRLEAARIDCYMTANNAVQDKASLTNEDAARVFFMASDVAKDITLNCITKCGGMGYTKDFPVEQHFRDSMLYEIGGGARDIRLEIVYRDMKLA